MKDRTIIGRYFGIKEIFGSYYVLIEISIAQFVKIYTGKKKANKYLKEIPKYTLCQITYRLDYLGVTELRKIEPIEHHTKPLS